MKKLFLVWAAMLTIVVISCSRDNDNNTEIPLTPSQILASTPWETTGAKDRNGNNVDLNDPRVNGFVGWAYFRADGNFAIYGLNDVLRSLGTWTVDPQGKTRNIKVLNPDGRVLVDRDVEILELNKNIFTYRIHSDSSDPANYYDIIHTRTSHTEPANGQVTLASTPWETTGAKDNAGNSLALNDPRVAGFVGYSYFKANGQFTIFGLDDVLRSSGAWTLSADGKVRNLNGTVAATGAPFNRDVEVLVLTNAEFTYRIVPDATNPSVFYDIIHTKVNHMEPRN
ncbi:DUF4822 domain-containing protein [Elizabethkingia meningoseptica]|uniref:DUF4822 domain-containing protein n=1 Tax=Elizabethkingia meningoseptica TaxID=238 RepID=UPI0023B1217B|nr:DUF4822 domain-containing protein [Elizabethkingia meningoseptica]MDE5491026.1 DUF4822 domain-containing protein [Elizabethkingia meningoseptica]